MYTNHDVLNIYTYSVANADISDSLLGGMGPYDAENGQ
jgi:hypothetical protein